MKKNQYILKNLLQHLLAEQLSTDDISYFSDNELIDVITGRKKLTKEQQVLLFNSPIMRYRLFKLEQQQRLKTYIRWQNLQIRLEPLIVKAASTLDIRREDIEKETYTLSLIPHDITGNSWSIILRLKKILLPVNNIIQLIDQNGMIWIAGYPDENGVVENLWQYQQSPLSLLNTVVLQLELV